MKSLLRLLLALLPFGAAIGLSGCTTKTDQDTSIPWSRPAGWEGQVPGMGTTPGSGNR